MTDLTVMYDEARRELAHHAALRRLADVVGVDKDTIARTLHLAAPDRFAKPQKEKT